MLKRFSPRVADSIALALRMSQSMIIPVAAWLVILLANKKGLLFPGSEDQASPAVGVLILASAISYVTIAKHISYSIVIRERDLHLGIVLYILVGALVIFQCAGFGRSAYDLMNATESADVNGRNLSPTDALYFSTATFTTLSYGDFVPVGAAGRWLAMFEASIGTAHSVFFVLIFLKGGVVSPVEKQSEAPLTTAPRAKAEHMVSSGPA